MSGITVRQTRNLSKAQYSSVRLVNQQVDLDNEQTMQPVGKSESGIS